MRRAILVAMIIVLSGCGINKAFLQGEEAAFQAIAPTYILYIESDETLDELSREDRMRTVRAWRFSLDKATKAAE